MEDLCHFTSEFEMRRRQWPVDIAGRIHCTFDHAMSPDWTFIAIHSEHIISRDCLKLTFSAPGLYGSSVVAPDSAIVPSLLSCQDKAAEEGFVGNSSAATKYLWIAEVQPFHTTTGVHDLGLHSEYPAPGFEPDARLGRACPKAMRGR